MGKVIHFLKSKDKATLFTAAVFIYAILEVYGHTIWNAFVWLMLFLLIYKLIKLGIRIRRKKQWLRSDIHDIDLMNGIEFENYLADFFESKGYSVTLTPRSGDYGVDLILRKGRKKTAVQAKCYGGNIGVDAVQQVISGSIHWRTTNAMVITNRYFTPNAKKLAKSGMVELIDRDGLSKLIN
ncbi:restriction endonuclease [Fictibacillus nanhaiensis]